MTKTKYFLIAALIAMLVIPAAAKKTKTATNENGVLTDQRIGYTMEVPDNWKVKTYKESEDNPAVLRVLMSQKNYQINREVEELDGDYIIPEIQVYARQDTMSPEGFLEKLKNAVELRNSGDDIISQLGLVMEGEFVQSGEAELGGLPVIVAYFKRNWERHLQADPGDPRYRHTGGLIVRETHDIHEVYILKHGGDLIVIQGLCEAEFYHNILMAEFGKIIGSLKFGDIEKSDAGQ